MRPFKPLLAIVVDALVSLSTSAFLTGSWFVLPEHWLAPMLNMNE